MSSQGHGLGVTIARQALKFSETAKRVHGALGDLRDFGYLREKDLSHLLQGSSR